MPLDDAPDMLLNAYIDGTLSGDSLRNLERRLQHDAQLRAQLEASRRIEASLRASFNGASTLTAAQVLALASRLAPPFEAAAQPRSSAPESTAAPAPLRPPMPWLQRLGVAAALAAGVLGMWMIWQEVRPERVEKWAGIDPAVMKNGAGYYNARVATGFQPSWVCRDEAEFAHTFRYRLGQALALKPSPDPGTRMLGLDYVPVLSPLTIGMLAESDAKPIVLVIDKRENDNENAMRAGCGSLQIFRRELGPLVMYEVTPFDQPRMLDLIQAIE